MFSKLRKKSPNTYLLVVGVAIVAFWHGVWGLFDLYIFPEQLALSYVISFLIGLGILYANDLKLKELVS